MDTNYCYGQIPALTREKYAEAHDLIIKHGRGANPSLQRPLQQVAARQHLAPTHSAADPPVHIPAAARLRPMISASTTLFLFVPELHRLHPRKALLQGYWDRVAARNAPDTSPYRPVSRRPSAWRTQTPKPSGFIRSICTIFYNRCLHVFRASPMRRATGPSRRSRPGPVAIRPTQGLGELTWKDLTEAATSCRLAGNVRQRMEG